MVICSGANFELGLSLLPLSHLACASLIARLDWRGGLFLDSASALLWGGERREVESCPKRTGHQPGDYYRRAGRALFPYSLGLRVHSRRHLGGYQACWNPSGSVSGRSPIVSGPHVLVIRPFV